VHASECRLHPKNARGFFYFIQCIFEPWGNFSNTGLHPAHRFNFQMTAAQGLQRLQEQHNMQFNKKRNKLNYKLNISINSSTMPIELFSQF